MSDNIEKSYNYQQNFLFYKKYHSTFMNVLVHIFCIPAIVWSMFGLANTFGRNIGIPQILYYKFMPSMLIYTLYMIYYYLTAPRKIFWSSLYFYLAILVESNRVYNINNSSDIFVCVQVIGWVLQILSHKVFEGNSPALLDGIVQVFATAPIFIVHEIKQYMPCMDIGVLSVLFLLYRYRVLYS